MFLHLARIKSSFQTIARGGGGGRGVTKADYYVTIET